MVQTVKNDKKCLARPGNSRRHSSAKHHQVRSVVRSSPCIAVGGGISASTTACCCSPLLLQVLLDSHFFIASGLSIVNRQAAEHTRKLAKHARVLSSFLLRRRCAAIRSMYYDTVPATLEGPTEIREDSTDVFAVMILGTGGVSLVRSAEDESIASLGSAISEWYEKHQSGSLTRSEKYKLPSGRFVDVRPSRVVGSIGVYSASIFLRGAVIRKYLKYNSLWTSLSMQISNPEVYFWITTTDDEDTYGEPDDDEISFHVSQSAAQYTKTMAMMGFL